MINNPSQPNKANGLATALPHILKMLQQRPDAAQNGATPPPAGGNPSGGGGELHIMPIAPGPGQMAPMAPMGQGPGQMAPNRRPSMMGLRSAAGFQPRY